MSQEENEWTLAEEPAIRLIEHLGYDFITPADISNERDRESEPLLYLMFQLNYEFK